MKGVNLISRAVAAGASLSLATMAMAATPTPVRKHHKVQAHASVSAPVAAKTSVAPQAAAAAPKKKVWVQTWDEPTYKDSTAFDKVDGEDLLVRRAAVEALGPYNGSVVVADPATGRVLTVVNQPLALSSGFQPCSTVKVSVALAALNEGLIARVKPISLPRRGGQDLTDAIAYSNNYYFANLGVKLGYERYSYYAHLFGYGEKAGLGIEGEHAGKFPDAPPENGGMGMLTSFGEEITQTPLELAALMGAVANGGTLYWMQYPRSQREVETFQPQVKRSLDIGRYIDTIKPGMRGAVDYGTAKRAHQDEEVLGKTGTCSEGRTHLGWFGSFNESGGRKLVVVVMLTGGKPSIGATASGVAGEFYRRLGEQNFFRVNAPLTPASILTPSLLSRHSVLP